MRGVGLTRRFSLLLTAWALVLLAHPGWAGTLRTVADVDGDGVRDRVTLDRRDPSVVRVRLSSTGTVSVLRSARPISSLVAHDLDGDHKAELIAADTRGAVHVWTHARQARVFQPSHAAWPMNGVLAETTRPSVDDVPTSDDPPSPHSGGPTLDFAPALARPGPSASHSRLWGSRLPRPLTPGSRSPFAPRPPPSLSL